MANCVHPVPGSGGYRHPPHYNDVVVVCDVPRRHRYYDDSYVRRHGGVRYTSSCCYRKVVRHARSVWYERARRRHRRIHYGDHYVRPYRTYDLGYTRLGYRGYGACRRIPLADGRGGWVRSRPAGCF
jgi:hypothetical protein